MLLASSSLSLFSQIGSDSSARWRQISGTSGTASSLVLARTKSRAGMAPEQHEIACRARSPAPDVRALPPSFAVVVRNDPRQYPAPISSGLDARRSWAMIIGLSLSAFTILHVALSLIGILAGIVVVLGMLGARRLPGWTALFLLTTI